MKKYFFSRNYLSRFIAKPRRVALFYAAISMVIMLLVWKLADQWIEEMLRAEAQAQFSKEVTSFGISLTQTLTRRLNLVNGLSAFATIKAADGTIPPEDFEAFAESLYMSTDGLRNIALAPHGVIAYVYPFEENKAALGYEPAVDERLNVREDVKRAITTKGVVMSLPIELVQGGLGIIARQAIFVDEDYWGLANIVIDVPPLLSEAGFSPEGNDLMVAIKDQEGQVFYGSESVFDENPVSTSILLPERSWELVGVPKDGWRSTYEKKLRLSRVLAGIITVFWTWTFYLGINRQARLEQNVKEKTENLRNILQDLQATEDRYQTILHSQTDLILRFSPEGLITFVNEAYCQFFGKKPDDFYGKDYLENAPKKIRQVLHEKIANLSQEMPIIRNENENIDFQGKVHWFSWSNQAIFNADGEIIEYQSVGRDITEQKKADEGLRKSQALYHQAESLGKLGHWEWDHINHKMLSCSDQFARTYEMTADEALVHFSDLETEFNVIHPDDRARYKKHFFESEEQLKGMNIEYRIITPSGAVRHLNLRSDVVLDDQGRLIKSFGTELDITDRVQADQIAQQQARDSATLFSVSQLLAQAPPESTEIALIIARQFENILSLSEVSIALYDQQTNVFQYLVDYFDPEIAPSDSVGWRGKVGSMPNNLVLVRAMETLEPQIVQASGSNINSRMLAYLKETQVKTVAILPLVVKSRFIGVIELETWLEEYYYTPREINLAMAIANQAALALERAQLYETTQHEILERKQTDEALRESEARYRSVVEDSPGLVGSFLPDGEIDFVNKSYAEYYQSTPEALIGTNFLDLLLEEDRADVMAQISSLSKKNPFGVLTHRVVDSDGKIRHQRWVNRALFDERQEIIGYQSFGEDIEEEYRTQQLKNALYQIAQEANRALTLDELFPAIHAIIAEMMAAKNFYIALYDKDEDLAYPVYFVDEKDDPPTTKHIGQGLTAYLLRIGQPLLCTAQKFTDLVERGEIEKVGSAPKIWLGVPLIAEGRTLGVLAVQDYHNPRAFNSQDKDFLETVSASVAAIIARQLAKEELQKLNIELEERVKLRTVELDQRIATVENLNAGMANMMDDLNIASKIARKKTRELLDSNVELESFTYSVSHDLRAPLRHIESFSRLLSDQLGETLDPTSLRYLNNIISSTERMRNLIEDLLTLSSTGRADLRIMPLDFNAIIGSIRAQLFDEVEGRQITWKIETLPPAQADIGLMKIFWENLIRNAVKYTRPRENAIIEIGTTPSEGQITFFIKDNGVGFDPEYHEQLFGVFQRLQKNDEFEGSGVGLATAKRIIERHGGKIWADGEPDKGAIFYFSLPQEPIY